VTRDPGEPPFDILVVDDEAFVRETLSLYLEGEGCRVRSAPCGEQALEMVADTEVEAAIVDIRMPGMDGLTLLSELKRRHPDLEVLMATGFQSLETAVEAMRRGACDYITKPITDLGNDLLRPVMRAVERRRLRLRNRELSRGLQRALDELGGLRGLHGRDAAALATIEEFGRRNLRASGPDDAIDSLCELLPRIAPDAAATVFRIEGGRPVPARSIGSTREPLSAPPPLPEAESAAERWIERAAATAEVETWYPLVASGELRGWLGVLAPDERRSTIAERTALRALADLLALTLAALATQSARSFDASSS